MWNKYGLKWWQLDRELYKSTCWLMFLLVFLVPVYKRVSCLPYSCSKSLCFDTLKGNNANNCEMAVHKGCQICNTPWLWLEESQHSAFKLSNQCVWFNCASADFVIDSLIRNPVLFKIFFFFSFLHPKTCNEFAEKPKLIRQNRTLTLTELLALELFFVFPKTDSKWEMVVCHFVLLSDKQGNE